MQKSRAQEDGGRPTKDGLLRLQYELSRRALADSDAKLDSDFNRARAAHLGVPAEETVVFGDLLPPHEPMRTRLALRRLVLDAQRHEGRVRIEGTNPNSAAEWTPIKIGSVLTEIPKWASYYFAPNTIARVATVVRVFQQHGVQPYLDVHCHRDAAEQGRAYRQQLIDKAYDIDNPFRGLTLKATLTSGLDFDVLTDFTERRADVVLPATVWREVDENIKGLFDRTSVLERVQLGTNRGLLPVGAPGTGKTAACRVIAAELAGQVTVVICSARIAQHLLPSLYGEVAHLSPAAVILEDLDLIVGDREEGYTDKRALAEFLNVLDGLMTEHHGVATVATTNDPRTIDAAAKRSARFDRIVQVPPPNAQARARILNVYLRNLVPRKLRTASAWKKTITDVAAEARDATGADLRELVRRAVLRHGDRFTALQFRALASDRRWTGTSNSPTN